MKEKHIDKKIVALGEEFDEYEEKDVLALDFDLFVYSYEYESYEGGGFAVWRKGDKYFYHELGHCSCNGPLDGIGQSKNVGFTLAQIETLVQGHYNDHGKKVVAEINKRISQTI